jgi:catechol 2,3-dioxygenase-like lactoylglutathione lyase family enzyme
MRVSRSSAEREIYGSGVTHVNVLMLTHVNQILGDFEQANAFYQRVFGAQEYMNSYHPGEERDASLFVIGDTCIELFSPRTTTSLLGRSLERYGDGWHSFEWRVDDLDAAREALKERGVRITTDYPGQFLMTHPRDTHGAILEICPHDMHNDPRLEADWSAAPWSEGPLGITGLGQLSIAVGDADAAADFFAELTGAEVVYRDRAEGGARCHGVRFPDHVLQLSQPVDPGPVSDFVQKHGQRLRKLTFTVRDVGRVREHFLGSGLRILEGDSPGAVVLDPQDNYGVIYEFVEGSPPLT